MMKKRIVISLFAVLAFASCRKKLCYEDYHPHGRPINVVIDYDNMDYVPSEMRLDFYSMEGEKVVMRFVTPTRHTIDLPMGKYKVICFNDNSEYISLMDEDKYSQITAYMPVISRNQYNNMYMGRMAPYSMQTISQPTSVNVGSGSGVSSSQVLHNTIGQPDLVFVDNCELFEVTDDPLQQTDLYFTPRNTTVVYHVHIVVDGMQYVKQARGGMTGISQGKVLYNKLRTGDPATVMFDCVRNETYINTSVTAFGMIKCDPGDPLQAGMNEIYFEFLLRDGSTYSESFDIRPTLTDAMCECGGIIDLSAYTIHIPEVDDDGFDAVLEDWYDEEVINL